MNEQRETTVVVVDSRLGDAVSNASVAQLELVREAQRAAENEGKVDRCEKCNRPALKTNWDPVERRVVVVCKVHAFGPLATVRDSAERIGRNDPCPCGSGVKFKKCCLRKGTDE